VYEENIAFYRNNTSEIFIIRRNILEKKTKVLLVDDEKDFIDVIKERLELSDYMVTACYDVEQALTEVQTQEYDVAVIDLILQDADGITAMTRMKIIKPLIECVVLSGQGTLKMAVEAMKQGAFEFLEKPCDHEVFTQIIDKACARKREQENRIMRAAKRVYSRIERAMVGATFAQAGQFGTAQEIADEKDK
jgi:two-component system response regulator CpxR